MKPLTFMMLCSALLAFTAWREEPDLSGIAPETPVATVPAGKWKTQPNGSLKYEQPIGNSGMVGPFSTTSATLHTTAVPVGGTLASDVGGTPTWVHHDF